MLPEPYKKYFIINEDNGNVPCPSCNKDNEAEPDQLGCMYCDSSQFFDWTSLIVDKTILSKFMQAVDDLIAWADKKRHLNRAHDEWDTWADDIKASWTDYCDYDVTEYRDNQRYYENLLELQKIKETYVRTSAKNQQAKEANAKK